MNLNEIMTGDARKLARTIPDASVDLVFTDPVYDQKTLYTWLARIARRVLKPGGAVLVWSNGKWHHQNARWMEGAGLTWRYDFGCVSNTGPAPMCGKVIAKTNRLIWLDVDGKSKMTGYLADGFISTQWGKMYGEWEWTKNPVFCTQALLAFTHRGALTYDPFTGVGTIPAVCRMQGRDYYASEIDPATAERARERLAATNPPLPGIYVEQAGLDLEIAT